MQLALHCWRAAKHYAAGPANHQVQVQFFDALQVGADELKLVDACIIFSAENFGQVAGGIKNLFDRSFYPLCRAQASNGEFQAVAYQLVSASGNDGSIAMQKLESIMRGLGANKVQDNHRVYGVPSPEDLACMHDIGEGFVAALAEGIF